MDDGGPLWYIDAGNIAHWDGNTRTNVVAVMATLVTDDEHCIELPDVVAYPWRTQGIGSKTVGSLDGSQNIGSSLGCREESTGRIARWISLSCHKYPVTIGRSVDPVEWVLSHVPWLAETFSVLAESSRIDHSICILVHAFC